MAREEARAKVIEDADTLVNMKVNANGSINVVNVSAVAPVNTTPVITGAFGSVATTNGVDTYYTITNAKTLTIQRLDGGSEENTGGSVVELFYDPNANLTGMTRLGVIYLNGSSNNQFIEQQFTGNGTRRIVLRARGFSSNSREMFRRWIGYEE